jgi:hypothetical protein
VKALERSTYGFSFFVGGIQEACKDDLFLFKKERLSS